MCTSFHHIDVILTSCTNVMHVKWRAMTTFFNRIDIMYMYVMHVKDRGKCSNIFILLTPITYDMNVKWGGDVNKILS